MKNLLSICVLFFIAHSALAEDESDYPGVKGSDQEIYERLTGTWTGKMKGFRGTLVYQANGECSSSLVPEDFLVKMVAGPYSFSGKWEIKHGVLWSTVDKSSTPKIVLGTRYRNELLLLTEDTFVTKNEKGWITKFERVR